ncbi:odorant receptor 85b [Amyelois transitella]|uniref:odorant receptor 85b n=1 Tax=Amyelois transitella TaxID=680683 RepID=UPI00067DA681|nr:odorant receptor 85b [Amyelois transitella]
MSLLANFRNFFMKNNFDFDAPEITLYSFHPQLRVFLAAMGIFFNNRESRVRFFWPIICVSLAIVAVTLESIFVHHFVMIKNYSDATECFCYFVLLGIIPFIYVTVLYNKEKILELVEDMNEDFVYISKLTPKYRDSFFQGHLLIYKLCYAWLAFTSAIAIMYISGTVGPLLWMSLIAAQHENSVRPLMFPMWLPEDDPYRTPNYEIFMAFQISFCFIYIQTFCVYVYTEFHILLHYYNLMELVIMDFHVIFEGLDEAVVDLVRADPRRVNVQHALNKRMGRIVRWHLSIFKAVNTVSSVYGPPLVYQVMFTAIALCLMGYQIADKLDHGKFDILFSMLFVGALVQLWIPCYLGTMIRNKGFAIGDACWNCGWHETSLGRMLRSDIIIVMHRSQQPVVIKFTGLPHLQLETFSSIVSSAYSYFNMLRQYNAEV